MSLSLEGWSKGETAGPFREPRSNFWFAYLCWANADLNPFLFSFLSENKRCPLISELSKNNALPTFQSHQSYSLLSPHLISFIFSKFIFSYSFKSYSFMMIKSLTDTHWLPVLLPSTLQNFASLLYSLQSCVQSFTFILVPLISANDFSSHQVEVNT